MSCAESWRKISFGSLSVFATSISCSSYRSPAAIAFWKIVGLDVTPTTASSFIIRARRPSSRAPRERLSIQTDWPRSLSSCRRDFATVLHLLFHLFDLAQAGDVALATVEARVQKGRDQVAGK